MQGNKGTARSKLSAIKSTQHDNKSELFSKFEQVYRGAGLPKSCGGGGGWG